MMFGYLGFIKPGTIYTSHKIVTDWINWFCWFSTPTGVETPDVIDLRKQQRKEPERPLYQVSNVISKMYVLCQHFYLEIFIDFMSFSISFPFPGLGSWGKRGEDCSWDITWNNTHVCDLPDFRNSFLFSLAIVGKFNLKLVFGLQLCGQHRHTRQSRS